MDILAHGIWAHFLGRGINFKKKKKMNVWWMTFWGMLPDLFSFTLLFSWLILNGLFGTGTIGNFERHEPAVRDTNWVSVVTPVLYEFSHSIIIFGIVFLTMGVIFKRFIWEMVGWGVHIIIDIPTHSYAFYPTPFLWPFSEYKFDGISWGNRWFMIANYSAMVIVFVVLLVVNHKTKKKKT